MIHGIQAVRWFAKVAALASSLGLLGSYVYVRAGGTLWYNSASPTSPVFTQDLVVPSTKSAPVFPPGQGWVVQEEEEELTPGNPRQRPARQQPIAAVPSYSATVQESPPAPQQPRVLLPGSKSMPIDFTTIQPLAPVVIKNPFVSPVTEQRVIPYQSLVPRQTAPIPYRPIPQVSQRANQPRPVKKSLAVPRQTSSSMQQ